MLVCPSRNFIEERVFQAYSGASGPIFWPLWGFWTWIWAYFVGSRPGFGPYWAYFRGSGPIFGSFLGLLGLDFGQFGASGPGFWPFFGNLGSSRPGFGPFFLA